ncbi:GNAT family N-acetyltransferase [Sphingobacterium composti Ten et al. 2007 non Yoo et al. 2007]|uniref:GNAT family N-acetyltransferase n=1 Tax=Sphingobacterium composti TaxID=363260 RepID=UPI00135933FF|nr:GNAT family N-acetyltransferase [Sphingobacterium composti Ten et al. 2007 non Yoo et al. 2007]
MNSYKVLNNQVFESGHYSIVPIRYEDRLDILKWRNEQIYHLRQANPLTEDDQEEYFSNVVSKLFDQEKPNQILFSYLKDENCIGYGGLVHINWVDKNAEISFIMDTALEAEEFEFHWMKYLSLLEQVAFDGLGFHKLYTYAFDIRPHLYLALEKYGFSKEAILQDHCLFNGEFIDVVIHSKKDSVYLRKATFEDVTITYNWANDPITRKYSFSKDYIPFENHQNWYKSKITDKNCTYLILENSIKTPLGSIRVDVKGEVGLISYLVAPKYQGRGLGKLLVKNCEEYLENYNPMVKILEGYVMEENLASINIFKGLGYTEVSTQEGFKFIKKRHENR